MTHPIDWSDSHIRIADITDRESEVDGVLTALYDSDVERLSASGTAAIPSREDWEMVVAQVGHPEDPDAASLAQELRILRKALAELGGCEELIAEEFFYDYIVDLIKDCYPEVDKVLSGNRWPMCHIKMDWDAAVNDAMQDYTEVEIEGYTFYAR